MSRLWGDRIISATINQINGVHMQITHLYTGSDEQSHFEDIELSLVDKGHIRREQGAGSRGQGEKRLTLINQICHLDASKLIY